MVNKLPFPLQCPQCLGSIAEYESASNRARCPACRYIVRLKGHACPYCGAYEESESAVCGRCDGALSRSCSACHTANWSGNRLCVRCGHELDIFGQLQGNASQATAERLQLQGSQAHAIRLLEQLASDERMAEMRTMERRRQLDLYRRLQHKRRAEQRKLIAMLLGVMALALLLVLYAALFVFL